MSTQQAQGGGFDWGGLTLFLASLVVLALCGWIVWPFLTGLTAAVVLAVVTARPQKWLAARVRNRTLAAALALLLVAVAIVTPTLLVAGAIGSRVIAVARSMQADSAQQSLQAFLEQHAQLKSVYDAVRENIDSDQVIEKSLASAAGRIGPWVGRSIGAVFQVVVMLFVLFFLYRDREEAVALTRSLLPLEDDETDFLLRRLRTSIQALVLGRFAVAGIQGLVAGTVLALLGVHAAVLLGVAVSLCAVVPAVGAYVVWLPVAVYLALTGEWLHAAILFAVGALVISTLDNFLYPIFVGSHLRLHTVPIFLAMLGGVLLFGVTGLVLGPIAFNCAAVLALIWRRRVRGTPLLVDAEG
ncbi:MAG TPA: AI-2E family transporter [Terracidiphilus sp.]|nr:AI-2E family transporter [Terracidiphilus sp.]